MSLIYFVAGEPSGDLLAARVMAGLRSLAGDDLRFAGVGGEEMEANGIASLIPQSDLAVMGLWEVLPRLALLRHHLEQVSADILASRPEAVVTVDSWGFNRRLLTRLKARGYRGPCIHLVAPMIWAWRADRAAQLRGLVDLLLCLMPQEPRAFQAVGVNAIHIGHPVLESGADRGDDTRFRARHGIPAEAPLICALPGSRTGEAQRLLPVFAGTLARLAPRWPGLTAAVPTVATVADTVTAAVASWPVPAIVVRGAAARYDAFAASRAALAASGTVTLELTMAGLPMVIAYKLAPVSAFFARRLVRLAYVGIPNLLTGREVAPEYLLDRCRAELLAPALEEVMVDEDERAAQKKGFAEALQRLGLGGELPSLRAARAILGLVKEKQS